MDTSINRDLYKVNECVKELLLSEYEKIRIAYNLPLLNFQDLVKFLHEFILKHPNVYEHFINFDFMG